ncbi:MAG: tRNA (guanine-N7-)-methyltransferase [Geotoga sp.]|nr:tRNA (guanine-N7-)-methyltransferase [Geotoga sp.]
MTVAHLKYMITPQKYKQLPMDLNEIFGNKRRVVVEIGFGGGEYLVAMAKKNLETNFIGIETSLTACDRAQKKIYNEGLKNIRLIIGDARFLLKEIFSHESISKVIVNFPCPWPKKRHKNRRIFVEYFRNTLASSLKEGGYLELATDVEWYAEEVKEYFSKDQRFEVENIEKNFKREIKTRYEKKWDKMGRDKFLIKIKKVKSEEIQRLLKEQEIMPHQKIKNLSKEKLESIINEEFNTVSGKTIIREKFENDEKIILRSITVEKELTQEYYIEIIKRDDEYLIKLDPMTTPFRTPGVKEAIKKIANKVAI